MLERKPALMRKRRLRGAPVARHGRLRSPHPLLQALSLVGVAALTVSARRNDQPWSRSFRLYVWLGVAIVVVRVVFRVVVGGGDHGIRGSLLRRALVEQIDARPAPGAADARLIIRAHVVVADDRSQRGVIGIRECRGRDANVFEGDGGGGALRLSDHRRQQGADRERQILGESGVAPAVPAHLSGRCGFRRHALQCDTLWKIVKRLNLRSRTPTSRVLFRPGTPPMRTSSTVLPS